MHFDIHNFIRSLTHDRICLENPVIPDGVINVSHLVEPLFAITRNGRALVSDVEYDRPRFLSDLLSSLVPSDASMNHRDHAIIVLSLLLLRAIDTAVAMHGDTTMEEILMMAADRDELDALRHDMSALPYVIDDDGNIRPNFASLSIFAHPRPITWQMLNGFVERHFLPTLPDLFLDDEEQESEVAHPQRINDFEYVDEESVGAFEADPLNGFDEFERHFFDNHYKAYEAGAEINDLIDFDDGE